MATIADENPHYWAEYTNLQHVKHELVRRYLGGWFPKLGTWAGRVIYVDTHAGRGRHLTGQLGSPLVALKALLTHNYRDALLKKSEFRFLLIERDPVNLSALQEELEALGPLPNGVIVEPLAGDAFAILQRLVEPLRSTRKRLAPAFAFVDPYGFKVPCGILSALMGTGRVELFVNLIWRELDMALAQGRDKAGMAATLDLVFDGPEWRSVVDSADFDERAEQAVQLLATKVGAQWWTSIRMLGDNRATRYLLVHFTNHEDGRDLMKDCVWSIAPHGGFYVRKSDNPNQQVLITPQPDLAPVKAWMLKQLRDGPKRWQDLHAALRPEPWRETHLNSVIRELRRQGIVTADDYRGRFGSKANPLLRL
ncbi:MAG: three-Cys-motif partner protein TcmP [Luteitalea sp.]|nr:three-Cys-motif partner protein TcmP [Luteitalea sp.]